jgi:hypothetical protein
MANEASITSRLLISSGKNKYQSQPASFTADISVFKGPTPGAFTASLLGTDVVLTELDVPGLCIFKNLDATNYVTIGLRDPETSKFYPLIELLPTEGYVVRLSRLLGWETGTGTGTEGSETNVLCVRADTAPCNVSVEAFEK